MSPFQAATLWDGETAPRTHAFFRGLAAALPAFPIESLLANNKAVLISHTIPLTLVTVATVLALVLLRQAVAFADEDCVRIARRWAYMFTLAALPAFPVFTQDFWLSMAWGRMGAAGINPYYIEFTPDFLQGLPLDHFAMRMSYGPLWAIISAFVMTIAGPHVTVAAVLFKLVLGAAWMMLLWLADRLRRDASSFERCTTMLIVGWLPVGVTQVVAEGHNDILLAAFLLLWLLLLRQRLVMAAPVALAISTLSKYASGPLFLLDMLYVLRFERMSFLHYVLRMIPVACLAVIALAPFFRSIGFFDGVLTVSGWQFLHMRDAADALERLIGIPLVSLAIAGQLFFTGVAIWSIVGFVRAPQPDRWLRALIASMAFVTFAASPHLWPWYIIWAMAPAALLPAWWLSRFIVGMGVAAPFVIGFWWVDEIEDDKDVAALLLYVAAIAWARFSRRLFVEMRRPSVPQPEVAAALRPAGDG